MNAPITHPQRLIQRLLLTLWLLFACSSSGASARQELVFLNWSEYMDPALIEKFERRHQVKVREIYFESDDARDRMLLETDGRGYDLALVNDAMVDIYRRRGWLAPAGSEQIPNLKHIDPHWLQAFDGVAGHAVPYFWGTLGIAYRADLLAQPPTSWMDLFRPAAPVHGRLAMLETQRDALGMALKALGYSANSTDSREIHAAVELLLTQRPAVKTYTYLVLDENSALLNGEVVMAMMYSGDALVLREQLQDIQYLVPQEGGNLWTDYLVVLRGSSNKALAYAFIDFLNQPAHAAQLASHLCYATPNLVAEPLLPEAFLRDPDIYPDKAVLARSEVYKPLPPATRRLRNILYSRLWK